MLKCVLWSTLAIALLLVSTQSVSATTQIFGPGTSCPTSIQVAATDTLIHMDGCTITQLTVWGLPAPGTLPSGIQIILENTQTTNAGLFFMQGSVGGNSEALHFVGDSKVIIRDFTVQNTITDGSCAIWFTRTSGNNPASLTFSDTSSLTILRATAVQIYLTGWHTTTSIKFEDDALLEINDVTIGWKVDGAKCSSDACTSQWHMKDRSHLKVVNSRISQFFLGTAAKQSTVDVYWAGPAKFTWTGNTCNGACPSSGVVPMLYWGNIAHPTGPTGPGYVNIHVTGCFQFVNDGSYRWRDDSNRGGTSAANQPSFPGAGTFCSVTAAETDSLQPTRTATVTSIPTLSPTVTSTISVPPTGTSTETNSVIPTSTGHGTLSAAYPAGPAATATPVLHITSTVTPEASPLQLSGTILTSDEDGSSGSVGGNSDGGNSDGGNSDGGAESPGGGSPGVAVSCGLLSGNNCLTTGAGICNRSALGQCFNADCAQFSNASNSQDCTNSGCLFNLSTNLCSSPPGSCEEIVDDAICEQLSACKWTPDTTTDGQSCSLDPLPCHEQLSSTDCTGAGCAWNENGSPTKCFRAISNSKLCNLITEEASCTQQKCLWIGDSTSPQNSYCEAWDVSCTTIHRPSATSCTYLPLCFFDPALPNTCSSFTNAFFESINYATIITGSTPAHAFPKTAFTVQLIGTNLDPEIHQVLLADVSRASPSCANSLSTASELSIRSYDFERKANLINAKIDDAGQYGFCVRVNASTTLGPFGNISIGNPKARIDSCSSYPANPYVNVSFELTISGAFLDMSNALFGLMAIPSPATAPNVSLCPEVPTNVLDGSVSSAFWSPLTREDARGDVIARDTLTANGRYTLCYVNRGGEVASCPQVVQTTSTSPPWLNASLLQDTLKLPDVIPGFSVSEFNAENCKSMTEGSETNGLLTHPETSPFKIGDGINPYAGSEVCVFVVQPQPAQGFSDPRGKVVLADLFYASLNLGDSLRVFSSVLESTNPRPCSDFSYTSQETCLQAACTWRDDSRVCEAVLAIAPGETRPATRCPSQIPGYSLRREVTYENFADAGEELSLATSADHGFIFIACLAQPGVDGLGVSLQYRTQSTYCPNDCKDPVTGTQNGVCTRDPEWVCRCNDGFTGVDCSRPAQCRGVGLSAETLRGADGRKTFDFQNNPCAIVISADPSLSNRGSSERMARFGIGLLIDKVRFKSKTATPTTTLQCAENYIIIRKGDFSGLILRHLCPEDLFSLDPDGQSLRMLVEDATQLYVEFRSPVFESSFQLSYSAVSLVCPGKPQTSGIPAKEDECDGRGECKLIDYATQTSRRLGKNAYGCTCRSPWASTFSGETCDTCAFGFQKQTFPACDPATICGANCSDRGQCLPGLGCRCDPGYYGLDCQLIDDGERQKKFGLDRVLKHRVPCNGGDVGNVVQSGTVDRTLTQCSLPGSTRRCRVARRKRGKIAPQQPVRSSGTDVFVGTFSSFRRQATTTNETAAEGQLNVTADEDLGMDLNALAFKNNYPDFIRADNISGTDLDVAGSFTVTGWVRFSTRSNGFLYSVVDSAFRSDGTSPALDRSLFDVLERDTPEDQLRAFTASDTLSLYFGIYVDGSKKQISLIGINPDAKSESETKEDWHYVRHYRLGEKQGDLFDGSWRWLSVRIFERQSRVEGQVFVDGFSIIADQNYVQCLPWLPTKRDSNKEHSFGNETVVDIKAGVSVIWGYRLQAALDELQVHSSALNAATIPQIAGLTDSGQIPIGLVVLVILSCCLSLLVYAFIGTRIIRKKLNNTSDEQIEFEKVIKEAKRNQAQRQRKITEIEDDRVEVFSQADIESEKEEEESTAVLGVSQVQLESTKSETVRSHLGNSIRITQTDIPLEVDITEFSDSDLDSSDGEEIEVKNKKEQPEEVSSGGGGTTTVAALDFTDMSKAAIKAKFDDLEADRLKLQIEVANLKEAAGQSKSERRRRHLVLLQRLGELKALGETSRENNQTQNGDSRGGSSGGGEPSSSDFGSMTTASVSSWQIMSQLASAMEFPEAWVETLGKLAHFLALDLSVSVGALYGPIFFFVVVITFLIFIAVLILQITTEVKSKKQLQSDLELIAYERQLALDEDKEYQSRFQDKRYKIALLLTTILSVLYVPVTNQALAVIFCHPNLVCIYDCYSDPEHQALVIVAVFTIALVTLCVPILFITIVRTVEQQFHTYLGIFQKDLQRKHWGDFVDNVENPFSSIFSNLKHRGRYFNGATNLYLAAVSTAIIGLPGESASQLLIASFLQILYALVTLFSRSFRRDLVNLVVGISQTFIIIMLLLRGAQLVEPENKSIGTAMIILTVIILLFQVGVLIYAAKNLIQSFLAQRQMKKERQERQMNATYQEEIARVPVEEAASVENKDEPTTARKPFN